MAAAGPALMLGDPLLVRKDAHTTLGGTLTNPRSEMFRGFRGRVRFGYVYWGLMILGGLQQESFKTPVSPKCSTMYTV